MLHLFFEEGAWFAPKRYGYGAGLPIAWQGWALLAAYCALLAGLGLLASSDREIGPLLAFAGFVPATLALVLICKARTRGGWRWRWGGE